jgi:hypothetical protein
VGREGRQNQDQNGCVQSKHESTWLENRCEAHCKKPDFSKKSGFFPCSGGKPPLHHHPQGRRDRQGRGMGVSFAVSLGGQAGIVLLEFC